LGDLGWVKEKAFSFCRQQQVKKGLLECAEMSEDEDKYDLIVAKMKKAISSGIAMSDGLDYANDIDARYSETYRRCIPTGIKELDEKKMLNGGLGGGEIGIVVAPTGVGKSHCLVHFGAQALLRGKNVLHYTLELNERIIGIRYDSHLIDISSTDCSEHQTEIRDFFQNNADKLGKLRIKQLPARSTTINTIRAHMEKLKLKDFIPDMIIVDYAGIMRSTNKYELLRLELKEVIQELRDFAEELDIPVWTALQSNKEGSNSDIVDLSNMAESYAQASIADVVFGVSRKSANKSTGLGSLFVAKNRAGMDGILYPIHMDTSKSKIRILGKEEVGEFEDRMEERLEETSKKNDYNAARTLQKVMNDKRDLFTKA
jgi:replicative DNA helicase